MVLVALNAGDELRRIEPAVGGRDEALDAAGVFVVPDLLDMLAENSLGHGTIPLRIKVLDTPSVEIIPIRTRKLGQADSASPGVIHRELLPDTAKGRPASTSQ